MDDKELLRCPIAMKDDQAASGKVGFGVNTGTENDLESAVDRAIQSLRTVYTGFSWMTGRLNNWKKILLTEGAATLSG